MLTVWSLMAMACSTTKLVPDDDQLFVGLKAISYPDMDRSEHAIATQEELEAALATQPNGALFGSSYYRTPLPYGLWVWNAFSDSHGKFAKWMTNSFGKPPVLMSQVNPALRTSVARSVLRKNGYMHGNVTYAEVPQKNPKKMKIAYTVTFDTLFTVDTMNYVNFPKPMQALIDSTANQTYITSGAPFTVANLDAERQRISQLFRNNGYYYYQTGYATYLADTFDIRNRARLRLQMADSLPPEALHPWYMGNTKVTLRRNRRDTLTDSTGRGFVRIYYQGKHSPVSPRVILRNMRLWPRRPFSYDNYTETLQKLNATGVFSNVDIHFTPRDRDTLDLQINCTFDKPYDIYIEGNVKNRTIGRMGPELKIGVTRRNVFRGAEKLDINLHGNYEWQTNSMGNSNAYQYGIDASLEIPRILAPFVNRRPQLRRDSLSRRPQLRRRFISTPWTVAKLSSDVERRPNYYKMHIVSGEWTYRWQPSATSRHEFSPLTLKYQYMNSHTERFDSVLDNNPFLLATMSDYFIPKMRYTYTYASALATRHPIRWETTIEESGNLTALYDVLVQGHGWKQKDKTLFKNPYAQFVRIETDLSKTWPLDSRSSLVAHLNAGIMFCYGNSSEPPFSEMFYVGGANSIRAFAVRSIGPGAFSRIFNSRQYSYLLQNGDSKLVMNLEYRRRLFGNLYGALFLDAGNVWNSQDWHMEPDDATDEAEVAIVNIWNNACSENAFKPNRFFKQLATGTGVGLRYDLDFLVLRLDWGFGLHVPYHTGKSGYFNIPRFKDMHTLHLAIGYPF